MNWQKEFYIVSPDSKYSIYTVDGVIETSIVTKEITEKNKKIFEELFKGEQYD